MRIAHRKVERCEVAILGIDKAPYNIQEMFLDCGHPSNCFIVKMHSSLTLVITHSSFVSVHVKNTKHFNSLSKGSYLLFTGPRKVRDYCCLRTSSCLTLSGSDKKKQEIRICNLCIRRSKICSRNVETKFFRYSSPCR